MGNVFRQPIGIFFQMACSFAAEDTNGSFEILGQKGPLSSAKYVDFNFSLLLFFFIRSLKNREEVTVPGGSSEFQFHCIW